MRIHLFGQPRFAVGDDPFKFVARPKCLLLLAHLLLHREGPLPRDSLAFLLWEDETEESARANLRRHLHNLQSALPEASTPWLVVDSEKVQWNPKAAFWLDVEEFERLLATADGRAEAVALYVGDLLENLHDDWLFASRERLRTKYLRILDELILVCRSERRFPAAIEFAQRMLTVDPLRETAIRQLISIRYESGDRAGALQTYEHFVRELRTEIGVAPMPETTALRDAIIGNTRLPSTGSDLQLEARGVARVALPFAGRALELEQIQRSWRQAARAQGRLVLVAGEAGIGKSRIVGEFVARAESEGARVMWGTTAYPETAPYQAFVEALRAALPIVAALDIKPLWLSALSQLVPELGDRRTDLPVLGAVEPAREQTRLLEGLAECLSGLARPRPLVLVLEDLHWAGEATVSALEFIARRIARHSILLLATYRDDETLNSLRIVRRSLQQDGLAQHVAIGRLGFESVAEIVALAMDRPAGVAGIAEKLWVASEGSPLFLSELIRNAVESDPDATLPPTLRDVIASRVSRLTKEARLLLEIVGIIGPAFDIDVAREITGWEERALLEAIDELLARRLIREAGGRSGFDYVFTHQLIRAAVYESVPAETRRIRHRRVALAFEALYANADGLLASDIARHFELADEALRAVPYYLRAARHAESLHAHKEALAFLSLPLPEAISSELHCEVLLLRETINRRIGNRAAQQDDIDRLGGYAGSDGALRAEVLYRKILLARSLGSRERDSAYIGELESLGRTLDSPQWDARLFACRADYYRFVNRLADAEREGRAALAMHVALSDVDAEVADLCLLAAIAMQRGDIGPARGHLGQAQTLAKERGNPRLVADTLFAASSSAMILHDLETCVDLARDAGDLYVSLGDREGEADTLVRIATVLARLGRFDEAREHNRAAAVIFESIGKRQGLAIAILNIGLISCRLGVFGASIEQFERSAELFRRIHDVRGQATCAINLSCVRLRMGRPVEAKADAERALELSRRTENAVYEAEALANLGAAERDLGELDVAIEHMRLGLSRQLETGRISDRVNDLADLALAYFLNNELPAACAAIEEVLSAAQGAASDVSLWPQNLYWIAARIYRAAGRDAEWPALLTSAHTIMHDRAEPLTDEGERDAFFELPLNREIEDAVRHKDWPKARR